MTNGNGRSVVVSDSDADGEYEVMAPEDVQIQKVQPTQPEVYLGDQEVIEQIKQRITTMSQVDPDTPDHVIWQFAQVCTAHQLNPFTGDAYIIKLAAKKNEKTEEWLPQFAVHIGIKGLRKLARRQAKFMTVPRRMDVEEVKQYRQTNYDELDVGYEVEIYRLDVARECKDVGIPYVPTKAIGFWRKKARWDKWDKEWKRDNIPSTWTPEQVAEKRAEVSALKKAFDIEIAVGDPSQSAETLRVQVVEKVQGQIEDYDRDHALPTERELNYDEDGNVLFA